MRPRPRSRSTLLTVGQGECDRPVPGVHAAGFGSVLGFRLQAERPSLGEVGDIFFASILCPDGPGPARHALGVSEGSTERPTNKLFYRGPECCGLPQLVGEPRKKHSRAIVAVPPGVGPLCPPPRQPLRLPESCGRDAGVPPSVHPPVAQPERDIQRESQWPRWGLGHGLGCPVAGMSQSFSGRRPGYTQTPASREEVGTGLSIVVTAAKSGEIKKKSGKMTGGRGVYSR